MQDFICFKNYKGKNSKGNEAVLSNRKVEITPIILSLKQKKGTTSQFSENTVIIQGLNIEFKKSI